MSRDFVPGLDLDGLGFSVYSAHDQGFIADTNFQNLFRKTITSVKGRRQRPPPHENCYVKVLFTLDYIAVGNNVK